MAVLVTGGAGYIGSHTSIELLNSGYDVVVIDNFCNSHKTALDRVQQISGKSLITYDADVRDREALQNIFDKEAIDAVIHFAGLKAVGESVENPILYYQNNVAGSLTLFEVMQKNGVFDLVFSSSATVYGDPESLPIKEDAPTAPANPYGQSKLIIETALRDLAVSNGLWKITALRYFNPVGAHQSGLIGEDPRGIPNNLMPFICQVAVGKLKELLVYGADYQTKDGTGVRDYIHVVDLARGHIKALEQLKSQAGFHVFNLGTGQGYSVFELLRAFEKITGKTIPYQIVGRREGDIAACYADVQTAHQCLNWKAEKTLEEMVGDSWNWQLKNPKGYQS